MVDVKIHGTENASHDDGDWPKAVSFTPDQRGRFAAQRRHQRDIWIEWLKLLGLGVSAAVAWLAWYALTTLAPPQDELDEPTRNRIHESLIRIEAPLGLSTLAVIATLTVAVAVAVRGLADPQSAESQAIDEARRQFLTYTARILGIIGAAIGALTIVWNVDADSFGLPGAIGIVLVAAATSAIAADSITVLGRARSSTPLLGCWLREQAVERILGTASGVGQELEQVHWKARCRFVGGTAAVLGAAGVLLGAVLLIAFPFDLIHTFWSVPDRLWRSALAGMLIGGGVLFFGYRLSVHWLLRELWSVGLWILMSFFFALALTIAVVGVIGSAPNLASIVVPPTLVGGTALVAGLMLALNFGPVRLDRRRPWPRLVPDLGRQRGGEVWRRIDKLRRANFKATPDTAP